MTAPTTAAGGLAKEDTKVLLARLRVAVCRSRLETAHIEEVGALLGAGRIDAPGALYLLRENGVLGLVLAAESEDAA